MEKEEHKSSGGVLISRKSANTSHVVAERGARSGERASEAPRISSWSVASRKGWRVSVGGGGRINLKHLIQTMMLPLKGQSTQIWNLFGDEWKKLKCHIFI